MACFSSGVPKTKEHLASLDKRHIYVFTGAGENICTEGAWNHILGEGASDPEVATFSFSIWGRVYSNLGI
jgi:hypothetical protein